MPQDVTSAGPDYQKKGRGHSPKGGPILLSIIKTFGTTDSDIILVKIALDALDSTDMLLSTIGTLLLTIETVRTDYDL